MKKIRNTDGLKKHAIQKNQETIDKVNAVIDRMKRSKSKTVNFKTVAEEAGISKATLYNNPALKERIVGLRAICKGMHENNLVAAPKDESQKKDEKIKELYKQLRQLKKEQESLIIQLVEMEEIKGENQRLKEQLSGIRGQ